MPIVSTMILNSLVMSGEKGLEVTTFTSRESDYYLSRLNSMMDSWSNERLNIYCLSQTSFALTASDGTYTIGPGGDFNMTRPIKIVDPCFTRNSDDTDIPIELIDADTYGRIVDKSFGDATPNYLFYDASYSATSTAVVKLYPLPEAGLTLFINTLQPLQTFSTMTTPVQLPPGYQQAIETNFAIQAGLGLSPPDPLLIQQAQRAKATIKTTNLTAPTLRLDYGIAGGIRNSFLTGP